MLTQELIIFALFKCEYYLKYDNLTNHLIVKAIAFGRFIFYTHFFKGNVSRYIVLTSTIFI